MRRPTSQDEGFTMVELVVVTLLVGILASIGMYGFVASQKSMAARGTQRELTSNLRALQVRAVGENTAYCVDLGVSGGKTWTVYRLGSTASSTSWAMPAGFTCSAANGTAAGTYSAQSSSSISGAAFEQRNGSTTSFAVFYPRGTASAGSVRVTRDGVAKYTLTVDGLTARVSSNGN